VPKLTIGGSLRWQDSTHVDGNSDRLYKLDSYYVVGANADYALSEQLSLSLSLDNALDKEYRVSNYSHTYGAPLNATLSLRAKF
jgi:outer membrane receptor for ferric coprogen and ferric-rhodotorulic acid